MAKRVAASEETTHKIIAMLASFALPIDSVNSDPDNANEHPQESIDSLKDSLLSFGQYLPLIVQRQGMIVRIGNGRLEAARQLGWTHVACFVVDESEVASVSRAITDNATGRLSHFNEEKLKKAIDVIRAGNEKVVGFLPGQLASLMSAASESKNSEDVGKAELEISPELHERHDYLLFIFDNEFDWQVACEAFGVKAVRCEPNNKSTIKQTGLGRVISAKELLAKIGAKSDRQPNTCSNQIVQSGGNGIDN